MKKLMKAVQFRGAHDIVFGDVETPEPAHGEVLIRVRNTGICGTDVEIAEGTQPYYTMGLARFPIIPGHEWSGEVAALGSGVDRFTIGDHVVGECSIGCGQCAVCFAGNYHRCPNLKETGILNLNGGFAEYMSFPAMFLHKLPADIPLETACLVEPTAVAYNGVRHTEVTPSDYVAIIGDGPIGLLSLLIAQTFGAKKVVLVGATPDRLAKAAKLGADTVIDANENDVLVKLREAGNGSLPDALIEATGNAKAMEQAVYFVRSGGRITMLGIFGGRKAAIDLDQLVIREITLRGRLGSPGVWPAVIQLIASGRIDPSVIISHRIPLSDFSKGIDMVRNRKAGVVKVVAEQN